MSHQPSAPLHVPKIKKKHAGKLYLPQKHLSQYFYTHIHTTHFIFLTTTTTATASTTTNFIQMKTHLNLYCTKKVNITSVLSFHHET